MHEKIQKGSGAVLGRIADRLGLLAAPTFAVMALLTAYDTGQHSALCSGMLGASRLSGMTLMYALMSVFHAAPWLEMISRSTGRPAALGKAG